MEFFYSLVGSKVVEEKRTTHLFELFYGGVPPLAAFDTNLYYLEEIVDKCTSESDDEDSINNFAADTCLIALLAHFETFCKNIFSSIINICPQTLSEFSSKRKEDTILLNDLVRVGFDTTHVLGFLVAERRDFSDLKLVNGLFFDLLGITPFSEKEKKEVRRLKEIRNLLVHHGGMYTSDYAKRHSLPYGDEFKLFFRGTTFDIAELKSSVEFLMGLASKLAEASVKTTKELISKKKWVLTSSRKIALDFMKIDIDGNWSELIDALNEES